MDTKKLTNFIILANELSFSRAAKRLFITQQALSKSINALEEELGIRLFERKPRVTLTNAGSLFLDSAQRILATEREFSQIVSRLKSDSCLRIGLNGRVRESFFHQDIILEFRKAYPNVLLQFIYGRLEQLDAMLLRGDLNLRIGYILPEMEKFVYSRPLFKDKLCLVVPKAFLQGRDMPVEGEYVKITDFSQFPFVLYPKNAGHRRFIDDYQEQNGLHLQVVLEMDSNEAMLLMSSQGVGITFLSYGTIFSFLQLNPSIVEKIAVFPIQDLQVEKQLSLVYPRAFKLSSAAEYFIKLCENIVTI